jgi:hypothetical protein
MKRAVLKGRRFFFQGRVPLLTTNQPFDSINRITNRPIFNPSKKNFGRSLAKKENTFYVCGTNPQKSLKQ